MSLTVTMKGDRVVKARLLRYGQEISDFTELWEDAHDDYRKQQKLMFRTRGYGTWAPLTARYNRWKSRRFPGKPILRRTDALFEAAIGEGPGAIKEITPTKAVFGIDPRVITYAGAVNRRRRIIWAERVQQIFQRRLGAWVRKVTRRVF